jgi:hypothetical protein
MATKLDPISYLNFWQEAEKQEFGILVEVASEEDKRLLVNALYACKRATGGFENLMIAQPGVTTFFIVKKTSAEELP